MDAIDSKIVYLADEKYIVYLKRVPVKSKPGEQNTTVKAFVKKIGGRRKSKIKELVKEIDEGVGRLLGM